MNTCRNIRFIASAGTGKTHQVVSLYQSLLFGHPYPPTDDALPGVITGSIFNGQSRVAPEHILMLTFTKNAAAEMRSRVTQAIEHELASGNPDNEAFCWSLLRRLSAATISTIHSFAQQILAAHTLHLGLAPNLEILEETDAADLRQVAIETALKAALTGSDAAYVHDLEILCDGRGIKGIKEGILSTLRSCAAWGLDLTDANPASLVTQPSPSTRADLETLIKKLEASTWQKSKKRDDVLTALKGISLHKTILPLPSGERVGVRVSSSESFQLVQMAKTALAQSGGAWGKTDDIKSLRADAISTLSFIASYPDRVEATRLLISFLTLTRNSALHIQGRKRALGALDFDDLLFKARDLIHSRPATIPEIKVIIVDEAQDNSHLQNELIHLVQSASKADLIMCGDTKQTIYGWRGADPNGLPEFAKSMHLDAVPLHTSYRSQKGILDWVNDIFAGAILGPTLYGENETLTPCPAAKALKGPSVELLLPGWETQPNPQDPVSDSKTGPKPRITLTRNDLAKLAANNPDDDQWQAALNQAPQAVALEARAVARRIRLLTTPVTDPKWHPARVWDSSRNEWIKAHKAPYRFRDILILLRAGTLQEDYEQALQEEGIPFTTDGKGRGFFARQEILDVANLLAWLASPNDRLSWLGLLRSPFVALSDNAIAILEFNTHIHSSDTRLPLPSGERVGVRVSLFAQLQIDSLLDHNLITDAEALQRAIPILKHLHLLAGRVSAVELVREAIRLTGYDAILTGTFHGVQRLANLQKLLTWLQARECNETLNLQQIARRLSGEINGGREAPDAAVLDPDDDSVRINTIHAAKGLSSPVVILPDLRRLPASDRDWILLGRNAAGVASNVAGKFKQYTDDTSKDIASEQFEDALASNKTDRDSESRRLFYVACTRARDLLILSGENPYNGNENAWRSWINRHLLQCNFNPSLITLHPYGDVERAWRTIAKTTPEQPIPDPSAFQVVCAPSSSVNKVERYRFPVTVLISSLPIHPSSLTISSSTEDDRESPEPTVTIRARIGTLAHRILETLDYGSPVPLADQINNSPEWTDIPPADRKRIQNQVQAAAKTISTMLGATSSFMLRELPFAARFDHDGAQVIADGKVDLLFLKDNRWHLVDYKFSDLPASELKARYANQLYIYREALSSPAGDADQRISKFACADTSPAEWKLILLSINSAGHCTPIQIEGTPPENLQALLIQSARKLARE